ncbi:MAG: YdeI/OmpD-associated family protein [Candidatus Phosphoribacter sp.]
MAEQREPEQVVFFDGPAQFRSWLEANHDTAPELWMGLRKKHVEPRGLTWAEAVPEALCFGWIDSVMHSMGPDAVRQRWTPRRKGSVWSSVNIAHVERLTAEGRMRPAGIAAYQARVADKQGIYAYEQSEAGELPEPYAARLAADPRAAAFWARATASYRKQCIHWVVSAKQAATSERRLEQLMVSCAAYELIPSMRYGQPSAWVTRARAELSALAEPSQAAEPDAP